MATKIKALQMWCRKMTEGYPNVDIANFTTSWRDGMAFCALIHRFRPDLIDFEALSSENVFDNCKMAFEIAEKELSIPAFLEADDMARLKVPDKLSIITYVSQYYNYLHALPQLGGPGVREKVSTKATSGVKRPPDRDTSQAPTSKKSTTEAAKENEKPAADKSLAGSLGDRCGICRNKVYLLERHIEGGKLYHRSCFRHSELSPTSKVYTRSPFMSPSLSAETPLSPSHLPGEVRAGVGDTLEQKDPAVHQNVSNSRAEPSAAKKNELAGMKHTLAEPDREDSKKSKIKEKLESLKAKYTMETKDKTSEKSFPLSSKEAHKLEKRKAEIHPAEKTEETASKGSKRNIPLIFQQKEKEAESSSSVQAKSVSSSPTSKIPTSPSSVSQTTGAMSSGFKSAAPSSTAKITLSKDQDHAALAKDRLTNEKPRTDSHTKENKLNTAVKKDTLISDLSNARYKLASAEASKTSTPTAKPRSYASKLAADVSSSQHTTADTPKSKDSLPKAAPRKAVAQTPEKKSAPDRPKDLPPVKNLTGPVSKTTPSPLSPPPLPPSQPPPLPPTSPASNPPGEVSSPVLDNQNSKVSKAEWKIQEPKSLAQAGSPKDDVSTQSGIQRSTSTPDAEHKQSEASKVSKDSTAKPSILKSSVTVEISKGLGNKDTFKGSDRRWSTPPPSDPEPLAVFVNLVEKDDSDQVRTDLLASLTGVRARTMSMPGSTSHSLSLPSSQPGDTPSSKPDKPSTSKSSITIKGPGSGADYPKGAHVFLTPTRLPDPSSEQSYKKDLFKISSSKGAEKETNSKHSANPTNTPTSKQPDQLSEALNILSSLKHVDASQSVSVKTDDKLSQQEDKQKSKAPQIVGILKNGNKKGKEEDEGAGSAKVKGGTSQSKYSDDNPIKHKSQENVKNPTKNSRKDSEIPAVPKPGTNVSNDTVGMESKSTAPKKDDPLSLSSVKLKRVMPETKLAKKESDAPLFDVKLKKVDDPLVKPARSKHEENSSRELSSKENSSTKASKSTVDSVSVGVVPKGEEKAKDTQGQSDDIPQWKKDIEERKKKLREDVAKTDLSTVRSKYTKDKTESKERPKSADISDLIKDDESDVVSLSQAPSKVNSPRRKSFDLLESRKEEEKSWEQILEAKAKLSKPKRTTGSEQHANEKLEWQIEAEKRMAALAAIATMDKNDHKKQTGKQKSSADPPPSVSLHVLSQAPTQAPTQVSKHQLSAGVKEETGSTKSKSEWDVKPKGNVRKDSRTTVEIKKETNGSLKHVDPVTPSRGIDFVVKKTNLRPLQIKFDVSPAVWKDSVTFVPENKTPTDENGGVEDFREKLRQLKHVDKETAGESKQELSADADLSKGSAQSDTTSKWTVKTSLTFNNHNNNNNNNNDDEDDKARALDEKQETVSDKDHITKLQERKQSVFKMFRLSNKEKKSKEQENGSPAKDDSVERKGSGKPKVEVKSTSPKFMRKISVLGRNKKGKIDSPPQSPSPLKKIEVSTIFDFENSLDLSLTENTAKLTLHDTRTPPPRPPPPHGKAKSPGHISAIELQQQLLDIDGRLTELELRGRDLEDSLRKVNAHEDEDDELMKEWFGLVSEKNELVRREADLVYVTREQELENEQDQIESQLHYLISIPDECKSPAEKEEEGYLIDRKIKLVEQRDRIVNSMDEDRLRYIEEDRNIEVILKGKGLWKNESGTMKALHGKKVAKSKFYT